MNRRHLLVTAALATASSSLSAQHRRPDGASLLDFDSLERAAASGLPVYCPPGFYSHGSLVLANGTEFYGSRQAIFQVNVPDVASFRAHGLGYFYIAGITIRGHKDATGATGWNNRAAIVVSECEDFVVEDCAFIQHAGSGVTIGRQGRYVRHGVIRNNTFIKGDMSATGTPYGTQDCAPVQVYQHSRNIEVCGNRSSGSWYCGFLAQDLIGSGTSRIHGLEVHHNYWENLSNYGIVLYTWPSLKVTRISDNGSGAFRVTTSEPHGVLQGEAVHLSACGAADGIWSTLAISPTELDLLGSSYTGSVSLGILSMSESCAGRFYDNQIDGIDGSREYQPGNKPYGAGLYVLSAGGVIASNNVFRRTNLQSNSETLTPASIGVVAPTGPVQILGGSSVDSGHSGVSVKSLTGHGPVFVGGGLQIIRPAGNAIRLYAPRNVTLDGIDVVVSAESSSGRLFSDAKGFHVAVRNVKFRDFNVDKSTNAIEISQIDHVELSGNSVNSLKPRESAFEAVRIRGCSNALFQGNNINGGQSAYTALVIHDTRQSVFESNRIQMMPDSNNRPVVSMTGNCAGTVYGISNEHSGGSVNNASSGGAMHTREISNNVGRQVRQAGDTITNSHPRPDAPMVWIKSAPSAGSKDWVEIR